MQLSGYYLVNCSRDNYPGLDTSTSQDTTHLTTNKYPGIYLQFITMYPMKDAELSWVIQFHLA